MIAAASPPIVVTSSLKHPSIESRQGGSAGPQAMPNKSGVSAAILKTSSKGLLDPP
jgi:hypothetical protein